MSYPGGGIWFFALIYFVIVIGIVAAVITTLWRMARAQELIAARLIGIEEALRESRGG